MARSAVCVVDMITSYDHPDAERLVASAETALPHVARLIEPIAPKADTHFVFKTRHSIFYGTPLEELLRQEGVERIVLSGQVTEQCILYSALDAYIRHFDVAVAADATAHIHADLAEAALKMMEVNMRAEIAGADEVSLP